MSNRQPHLLYRLINSLKLYREHIKPSNNEELLKFIDNLIQNAEIISTNEKAARKTVGLSFGFLDSVCGYLYEQLQTITAENKKNKAEADQLLTSLKEAVEEINALQRPPHRFAFFEGIFEEKENNELWIRLREGNRHFTAVVSPKLVPKFKTALMGQKVRFREFAEGFFVMDLLNEFDNEGEVVCVVEMLTDGRVKVKEETKGEIIVTLAACVSPADIKVGDRVLLSLASGMIVEKLSSAEVADLILQEVPTYSWDDIGGLERQISDLRDEVESNLVYPETAKLFDIEPTKGILIIGPPGVGKTLIAKVVLSETVELIKKQTGRKDIKGFCIVVNGPADVLRGIVGESPRQLRLIFSEAKRKAKEGNLVFIILDEFESLFRIRSSMILDAGVGNEDVNQFNAEMDGIKELNGVIVLALSNRPDLIDPAVIRPGRFDLKIEIPRYDKETSRKVFSKYIKPTLKFHSKYKDQSPMQTAELFVNEIVNFCYDVERLENQLIEITDDESGESTIFTIGHFMSGALIKSIVSRAKKIARRRFVSIPEEQAYLRDAEGLMLDDLYQAVTRTIREEIKLPTGEQALEEWLQVEGYRYRRIRKSRFLIDQKYVSPTRRGIMS